MEGASINMYFMVVILMAFASCLSPYTVEARHKHHHCHHRVALASASVSPPPSAPIQPPQGSIPTYQIHGCGDSCCDSNDCGWPCTVCCANKTCCYSDSTIVTLPPPPAPSPPLSQPASPPPSTEEGVSVTSPPPVHNQFPPYQVRDCGYGACVDSNDCNPPCATCCANHTCCYDDFLFH